jgi:cytochrome c oxidase assembly protein subunit 15
VLSLTATLVTIVVVVLGAYVRLSDAGLGCPDWPGCYDRLTVPSGPQAVADANDAYPERPVDVAKGWKEMVHRYAAGGLGILVAVLAGIAWRLRGAADRPHRLATVILVLVTGQAILGMWTVTWNLKPLVVMAHLLGGMTVLSLLWWQALRSRATRFRAGLLTCRRVRLMLALALTALVTQIALGGWTSANYAALACNEFPTCKQGSFWPEADFTTGFELWHGLGRDYEYATHISHDAKVAIHLVHRLGAVVLTAVLLALAGVLWRTPGRAARRGALAVVAALAIQLSLGVGNVVLDLPLWLAVAHNAGAAGLLLLLVTLTYLASSGPRR